MRGADLGRAPLQDAWDAQRAMPDARGGGSGGPQTPEGLARLGARTGLRTAQLIELRRAAAALRRQVRAHTDLVSAESRSDKDKKAQQLAGLLLSRSCEPYAASFCAAST